MELLLRVGADETALDDNDQTPMELIQRHYFYENRHQDSLARVTRALERAPADMAWHRRGTGSMCRAFFVEQLYHVETRAKVMRIAGRGGGRAGDATDGGDFDRLMFRLFALKEDGLSRTIMSFL